MRTKYDAVPMLHYLQFAAFTSFSFTFLLTTVETMTVFFNINLTGRVIITLSNLDSTSVILLKDVSVI